MPRSNRGVDFSDQPNCRADGCDAAVIADTAFCRNPNYHTARDTAGALGYVRMAMAVDGVRAAVFGLSP